MQCGEASYSICISGHFRVIKCRPRNIQIEFSKPNLTPFVQPLGTGIIRCFKAHYRKAMCIRAIELDDAGVQEIYKLNILEGMKMAQDQEKISNKIYLSNRDKEEPMSLRPQL
jgi:DDE superfamily endonuclease